MSYILRGKVCLFFGIFIDIFIKILEMRFALVFNLLLISTANTFSQNYNLEAYQFHQSIVEAQQNVGKEVFEFNERATDLNLKILKFELNNSMKFIDSLKVYNNETAYYNAAKKLFALYKDLSENEYPQLLKIIEEIHTKFPDIKNNKSTNIYKIIYYINTFITKFIADSITPYPCFFI